MREQTERLEINVDEKSSSRISPGTETTRISSIYNILEINEKNISVIRI